MTSIFKIFTAPQWDGFQNTGQFNGSPDDERDGFIHLSAPDQVQGTLDKHFAGQDGLVLAEFDADAFGDALRWEESRGGAQFPHLYGPLMLSEVRGYRLV